VVATKTVKNTLLAITFFAATFAAFFASCEDPNTRKTYTVHYDANGGIGKMASSVFVCETDSILPKNTFTRERYIFAGWHTNPNWTVTTNPEYADGQKINKHNSMTITLYAVWLGTYTIKYDANGGIGEMADSVFPKEKGHKLPLNTFTREGYIFAGWTSSPDGTAGYGDETTLDYYYEYVKAEETLTFYAVWKVGAYSVRYVANGGYLSYTLDGSYTMADTIFSFNEAQNLERNIYRRSDYTFAGWAESPDGPVVYADGESVINLTDIAGTRVYLYAVWVSTYWVIYNKNNDDANGSMSSTSFTYNVPQNLRANTYFRTGYIFTGWAEAPDGPVVYADAESVINLAETGYVYLYAVWEFRPDAYTVFYDANGDDVTGTMAGSIYFYGGAARNLTANAFTRTYFTFQGWSTSPDGPVEYTNEQSVANLTAAGETITLYAVWRGFDYTVRYDRIPYNINGIMEDSAFIYGEAQKLRPNAFIRPGYTFLGWATTYDSITGAGPVVYTDGESVINLTTTERARVYLYPVWGVAYTVIYNANGDNVTGTMDDSIFDSGVEQNLRFNSFNRTGYTFLGWTISANGQVTYTDGGIINRISTAGATVNLYAVWRGIEYTVIYDNNGGSGTMSNQNFTYDVAQTLRTNSFIRTGYAFAGWARTAGGAVEFTNGASVSNLTDTAGATVTLYAVWTDTYTVIYNANHGFGTMADSKFTYNQSHNLRKNTFYRTYFTFLGWSRTYNGTVVDFTDEQSVSNLANVGGTITLYAVWRGFDYTVEYNANGGSGTMTSHTFTYGVDQAVKLNSFSAPSSRHYFTGWATSPNGAVAVNNGQVISGGTLTETPRTVTLYAVWRHVRPLTEELDLLESNAVSGGTYPIEVLPNETIGPRTLYYSGRSNITINLWSNSPCTITLASAGSLFTVNSGVTLILDGGITLKGMSGNDSALVYVRSGGTLIMNNNSTITGNISSPSTVYGGGVYVDGTFTMNGGTISSNSTSNSSGYGGGGGGVFLNSGTFTMSGGTISNNTVSSGGGAVYVRSGTFTMSGGTISNNSTSSNNSGGGAVHVSSGTFRMNDGTISGNTASSYVGGGVHVSGGTFRMDNGTISGNNASSNGGGVYVGSTSSDSKNFLMNGGTITGNTAQTNGGGVYVYTSYSNFNKSGGTITAYSSGSTSGNRAVNGAGHAVYAPVTGGSAKRKETTAGPGVNLTFNNGSATGAWDY